MTNKVEVSPEFKRDIKPLAKKYHTLKQSIENLAGALIENPFLGVSYGSGMFKVRLSDRSKGSGKSGGFRVLYYHLEKTDDGITILLTHIYDKSEIGTIKKEDAVTELNDIIKEYQARK
ncbi:MAG: addiction module toxin RelE [Bacteroidetes bacterium]|nr:addiction module toxin RelE [Bacteroidota bacterium]